MGTRGTFARLVELAREMAATAHHHGPGAIGLADRYRAAQAELFALVASPDVDRCVRETTEQ